jgi:hypothetical protein
LLRLTHIRRARQQLRDVDGDTIAVHDDGALGHRQIIGKDADRVCFGGVELDDGAATQSQNLVDRHRCGAKHHGDVDGNLVECGHACFLVGVLRVRRGKRQVTTVW